MENRWQELRGRDQGKGERARGGGCGLCVVREGLTEKEQLSEDLEEVMEGASCVAIWRNSIPDRGKSTYKAPEARQAWDLGVAKKPCGCERG